MVNISNNIQLKANESLRNEDEMASVFPTFMWVVRDFVLRLVDSDQKPLTQSEYFERSLVELKGDSESIKAKNKIRTHIKQYFKERDCCTMVRPLADEK